MNKLLFLFIVIFSTSCYGEWKIFVNRDGAVKRYYNTETLVKNNDIVLVDVRSHFAFEVPLNEEQKYRVTEAYIKLDCIEYSYSTLKTKFYSGYNLTGLFEKKVFENPEKNYLNRRNNAYWQLAKIIC
jgi:hypothetical protein